MPLITEIRLTGTRGRAFSAAAPSLWNSPPPPPEARLVSIGEDNIVRSQAFNFDYFYGAVLLSNVTAIGCIMCLNKLLSYCIDVTHLGAPWGSERLDINRINKGIHYHSTAGVHR